MNSIAILFADTNIFLQVRDLKDIPWGDMFDGVRAVDVMIAPRVIEELDRHKSSANQRRRDRARAALHLIDQASNEENFSITFKEKPVRVRLVISAATRFDWESHSILDPAKPDDQLVAEALSFGKGAAIFSYDSGPRIRARIAGLNSYAPLSDWMLPIEQTDEQRKITSLERDLRRAVSSNPVIVAAFGNIDEATSTIRAVVPVLKPLDQRKIDLLSHDYVVKHPRVSLNIARDHMLGIYDLRAVSAAQAKHYEEKYRAFENEVRDYYTNLHQNIRGAGLAVAIQYHVENDSGVSAKGLRIEFELEGNGSLLDNRDDSWPGQNLVKMPTPPEKPRSTYDDLSRYSSLNVPYIQKEKDPVCFYWFERPKIGAKHTAMQCQDFRATRIFRDSILVLPLESLPSTLDLRLHISAENLPAPISLLAKLDIAEEEVDWSNEIVREILAVEQQ